MARQIENPAQAVAVAKMYNDRQSRRTNPDGTFDNGGRFYLSEAERCECCEGIRPPSKAWPYSQMVHARTLRHVRNLVAKSAAAAEAVQS